MIEKLNDDGRWESDDGVLWRLVAPSAAWAANRPEIGDPPGDDAEADTQ